MIEHTWDVAGHVVTVNHRSWPGLRQIWCDESLIARERKLIDRGFRRTFSQLQSELELVGVRTANGEYRYLLLDDGRPIPTREENAYDISSDDLYRSRAMGQAVYWDRLTEISGLHYRPRRDTHFWYRHRLIGRVRNRLVQVTLEQPEGSKVTLRVIVHVPPISEDLIELKNRLMMDERWPSLVGNRRKVMNALGVAPAHIGLDLPYKPYEQKPEAIYDIVARFVDVIADYTRELPQNWCAETQQDGPVLIASMNGFPVQISSAALEERQEWAEDVKRHWSAGGVLRWTALIMGAVVGLLTGFAWLMITLAFGGNLGSTLSLAAALLGPLAVALVVRVMHAIYRKPLPWLWLAALVFVVSGLALMTAWANGMPAFFHARGYSLEVLGTLPVFVAFAIVLASWYGLRGWRNQKLQVQALYDPKIEIIKDVPQA